MWKLQLPVTLGLYHFPEHAHCERVILCVCLFGMVCLGSVLSVPISFLPQTESDPASLSHPFLEACSFLCISDWLLRAEPGWGHLISIHYYACPLYFWSPLGTVPSSYKIATVLSVLDPQYLEYSGQLIKVYWMYFCRTLTELLLWFPWKGAICLVSR